MTAYEIFAAQLIEPFRIGLLIALYFTARNTAAHTGTVLPLLAGIVFVAILIPLTFTPEAGNWWLRVAIGLIANGVIVAVVMLLHRVYTRVFTPAGREP